MVLPIIAVFDVVEHVDGAWNLCRFGSMGGVWRAKVSDLLVDTGEMLPLYPALCSW